MSKLSKFSDEDIRYLFGLHCEFDLSKNLYLVKEYSQLIISLEKLFYYSKMVKLLLGIIIGLLAGFILSSVMFVIGRI